MGFTVGLGRWVEVIGYPVVVERLVVVDGYLVVVGYFVVERLLVGLRVVDA